MAVHAVELYLNALLLHAGVQAARIRGLQHDLGTRATLAMGLGLKLSPGTQTHLETLTDHREYIVARYGPEQRQNLSELNRLEATLEEVAVKTIAILDRGESKGLAA